MRIIRDYTYVSDADKGAAAAIGNFDGVHLGHQSVIDLTRREGTRIGAPLGIMTFEPHPRQYFAPEAPPFRLMGAKARAHRLEKLGVATALRAQLQLRPLPASAPRNSPGTSSSMGSALRHVRGRGRFLFRQGAVPGRPAIFRGFGAEMGFGVTIAELLHGDQGEVSSTAIRNALSEGRPRDAAAMLGHWHRIEGSVVGGDQRGRVLGYPTANMSIDGLHPPKFGVYAVLADVLEGPHKGSYLGAASMGVRPMFGENKPNLETFLCSIFPAISTAPPLSIGLVEYLRPEETFDSLDDADHPDGCATAPSARQILSAL